MRKNCNTNIWANFAVNTKNKNLAKPEFRKMAKRFDAQCRNGSQTDNFV
jgi:hypothetical protein